MSSGTLFQSLYPTFPGIFISTSPPAAFLEYHTILFFIFHPILREYSKNEDHSTNPPVYVFLMEILLCDVTSMAYQVPLQNSVSNPCTILDQNLVSVKVTDCAAHLLCDTENTHTHTHIHTYIHTYIIGLAKSECLSPCPDGTTTQSPLPYPLVLFILQAFLFLSNRVHHRSNNYHFRAPIASPSLIFRCTLLRRMK